MTSSISKRASALMLDTSPVIVAAVVAVLPLVRAASFESASSIGIYDPVLGGDPILLGLLEHARVWMVGVVVWSLLECVTIAKHARTIGEWAVSAVADPTCRTELLATRGVVPVLCAGAWYFGGYVLAVPRVGALSPSRSLGMWVLAAGSTLLVLALLRDLRRTLAGGDPRKGSEAT